MTEPSDTRDARKCRAKRARNSSRPWEFMQDAGTPERCPCPSPLIDPRDLEANDRPTCWWCGREVGP
jgi:hypothetical protein